MEVRVLRYFLTVVREESITKAAEALHITQPTLSRQLAQLEGELGVTLFSRGTRKISLTSEGVLLKRRAEEILELVDKTEQEMARQEELVEGVVAVGCGDLLAVQTLGELIRSFIQKYPRVNFDLYTATADHIKERMDRGVTDVGLLLEPVEMEKYEYLRLSQKEKCPECGSYMVEKGTKLACANEKCGYVTNLDKKVHQFRRAIRKIVLLF